ncbi:MAG: hypothetical protein R3E91_05595 [Chlamydiales bacterium]
MKTMVLLLSVFIIGSVMPVKGADAPHSHDQHYPHEHSSECNSSSCSSNCSHPSRKISCDPCAPICGTKCGISICAIGVAIVAIAGAAAIILVSGNGSSTTHQHI